MLSRLARRNCVALVALGLVLLGSFAVQIHRSGNIFCHSTRHVRCRTCGLLQKESTLTLFGISIYDTIHAAPSSISRILQPTGSCLHSSGALVRKREIYCGTDTVPGWRSAAREFGDIAGLPENKAFLGALATIARTNLVQARAVWSCLCRLDYRSSQILADYKPQLASTNAAVVLALLRSEKIFGFNEPR